MRYRMMDILCCPVCRNPFELVAGHREKGPETDSPFPGCGSYCEYISGDLASPDGRREAHRHCPDCYREDVTEGLLRCGNGHAFPIQESIPRLVADRDRPQRTKQTFDVEWTVFQYGEKTYGHSKTEELEDFFGRMTVDEEFLKDKTVLDAGCGIGRLANSISPMAREVIGVDFSEGVTVAGLLNREIPTVHIVQGDLMRLPFREASFDYVYSKGVLHYVSDAEKCLTALSALVKPGGALSATIYPKMRPLFERSNAALRRITVRLPVRGVYWLSYLLIPLLSPAWSWSGVTRRPIDWNERAHMIFNWFSSEFQNRASSSEVSEWFRNSGFDDIRISRLPVGITGIKRFRV